MLYFFYKSNWYAQLEIKGYVLTLEEAELKIKELNDEITTRDTTIAEMKTVAEKSTSSEDIKKAEQKAYTSGFNKAKNQADDDKKDFISKADVDDMLSKRDNSFKTQKALLAMGIKNPEKAMKLIDEDDLKSFNAEDFKAEDFKSKYEDVLVFKGEDKSPEHKPFTKNNNKPTTPKLTAEDYANMSELDRKKLSNDERSELLN